MNRAHPFIRLLSQNLPLPLIPLSLQWLPRLHQGKYLGETLLRLPGIPPNRVTVVLRWKDLHPASRCRRGRRGERNSKNLPHQFPVRYLRPRRRPLHLSKANLLSRLLLVIAMPAISLCAMTVDQSWVSMCPPYLPMCPPDNPRLHNRRLSEWDQVKILTAPEGLQMWVKIGMTQL
jgi:hypothetical protein